MRVKNSIRNAFVSIASQLIVLAVTLISRRIIVTYMDSSLLGYEGVFRDVLALLTFSELGIGPAIIYNLYRTVAIKDEEETQNLMIIYRNMYAVAAGIVVILGVVLIPFLPYICKESNLTKGFMYEIYIIQLIVTVSTYIMAYKRARFVAEQAEYSCIRIETGINVLSQLVRVIILYFTRNYLLYLSVGICQNVIANILISHNYNKLFGKIPNKKMGWKELKKRNLHTEMKNVTIHRLAHFVYTGTDNVVISSFISVGAVTFFINYSMICNQVNTLFDSLFKPMTASIGNLIYEKEGNDSKEVFWGIDLLLFFVASFAGISVFVLTEPFITLWLGSKYVLSGSFLLLVAVNIYMTWSHKVFDYYRNTLGNYQIDRKYMAMSAGTNLLLSVILVGFYRFSGVMIGTIAGQLCMWFGMCYCVFNQYLKCSPWPYVRRQVGRAVLFTIEMYLVYKLTIFMPMGLIGLAERAIICLIVPNIINLLIFYRTSHFGIIKRYIKSIALLLAKKSR